MRPDRSRSRMLSHSSSVRPDDCPRPQRRGNYPDAGDGGEPDRLAPPDLLCLFAASERADRWPDAPDAQFRRPRRHMAPGIGDDDTADRDARRARALAVGGR